MKEIGAIQQPFKVSAVVDALEMLPGVGVISTTEFRGFGHRREGSGLEHPAFGSLNCVAAGDRVDDVLATIQRHAEKGNVGDRTVAVSAMHDALRVRTGERGVRAL
jgi:nitrogen regulatory protein PII